MKPAPFKYFAPQHLEEALTLLADYGSDARLLAGGQSLIASMNFRCLTPAAIIDLNRVEGLDGLTQEPDGSVHIGALVRQRRLETDPIIASAVPLIHQAVPYIAHPAIRNRGTLGGSLAYADPAAEQPSVTLALNARYLAVSHTSQRWIPAQDFFTSSYFTALQPDEALVEVEIPALPPRSGWAIAESARRQGDRVLFGAAVQLTLDERGVCQTARIACLNAGPIPFLAQRAAQVLIGQKPSFQLVEEASQVLSQEIDPPDDVHASRAFRRHLAQELAQRALTRAFAQAGASCGEPAREIRFLEIG